MIVSGHFKVGDKVLYVPFDDGQDDGDLYVIEVDYGNGVYLIGNDSCFCDLVPAAMLRLV